MIGYGFMGRTHSNGYSQVNHFFDLEYQPVLQAVCARNADKAKAFADQWGYASIETDWRKMLDRKISMQSTSARRTTCTKKSPLPLPRQER